MLVATSGGHNNGQDVIEFVVDKDSWYSTEKGGKASTNHARPGTAICHPEWNQNITKIVIGDNYFNNPNFGTDTISGNGTSTTTPSTGDTSTSGSSSIGADVMKWPTVSTKVGDKFNPARLNPVTHEVKPHRGIDIPVGQGSNIYATEAGTVIDARYSTTAGNMVVIDHGNGYVSKYFHNSELKVKKGDKVTKGQVIALAGSTGNSTGSHCHFEIWYNGVAVDPLQFKYDQNVGTGTSGIGSNPDELSTTNKYYAKVATWTEIYDKLESNDPEVETYEKITYNMTTTRINYQEFVSGYTMPFEYLWSFLTVGQEEEFVSELADLVYGSEIFITVHDNLRINTNISTDTYTKMKKAVANPVVVRVHYEDVVTKYDEEGNPYKETIPGSATEIGGPLEDVQAFPYTTIHTVITSTNTLEIKLTEANVWIVEYKQEFTSQAPPKDEKSQDNKQENQPYTVTAPTADHTAIGEAIGESYRASVEASYSAAKTYKSKCKFNWHEYRILHSGCW